MRPSVSFLLAFVTMANSAWFSVVPRLFFAVSGPSASFRPSFSRTSSGRERIKHGFFSATRLPSVVYAVRKTVRAVCSPRMLAPIRRAACWGAYPWVGRVEVLELLLELGRASIRTLLPNSRSSLGSPYTRYRSSTLGKNSTSRSNVSGVMATPGIDMI